MIILRLFGGPIIWISLISLLCGISYGGYMLFETGKNIPITDQYQPYYIYASYAVWGLALLLLLCICCNITNIKIGVAVMKCTTQFLVGTPQVLLLPPLAILLIFAWFGVWVLTALFITSVGYIKPRDDLPFITTVVWS